MSQETESIKDLIKKKKSKFREYAEALITALLVALILRSFVIEAFKVPSGSMLPSIMIGDHLFVNKFIYGLRLPLTKKWFLHLGEPERGDTVVFIYPIDEKKDFIKRTVGIAGDRVVVNGTNLFINGKKIEREPLALRFSQEENRLKLYRKDKTLAYEIDPFSSWQRFDFYDEFLGKEPHLVQYRKGSEGENREFVVPAGHIFVMGDNRDNSSDSRDWGFVPMENLKGKAMFVWLSLDSKNLGVRWSRFGHWIE